MTDTIEIIFREPLTFGAESWGTRVIVHANHSKYGLACVCIFVGYRYLSGSDWRDNVDRLALCEMKLLVEETEAKDHDQ